MKNQTEKTQVPLSEMTLRDFFAAQAMQGLLSTIENEEWQYDDVAAIAFGMADEMMEARK